MLCLVLNYDVPVDMCIRYDLYLIRRYNYFEHNRIW